MDTFLFRDFNHLLLKEFHSGFLSFLWIHFLSGISIIIFLKEFRLGLLVSAGAFVDALDGGGVLVVCPVVGSYPAKFIDL